MKNTFIIAGLCLCCPMAGVAYATDIYMCTDASGKQLVSDRPIVACIDREQKLLSATGVLKKIVPPSYTAEERATIEARKKQAEQEALKAQAKARSITILAQRYPDKTAHQKARDEAAHELETRIRAANARLKIIQTDRQAIDAELEFYKKTPNKMPNKLREQVKASDESAAIALRYIESQNKDLAALHKRFDDEMALLETIWKKAP